MAKAKTTIKKITQNAWECTKIFKTGEIEKRIVKDPIDIWSIGNTGVRNPWRIPGGYKVYVEFTPGWKNSDCTRTKIV